MPLVRAVHHGFVEVRRCAQQCCVRVIFVESESQALRVRVESESSKIFSSRVKVMTWSSQSRVTRNVESLRIIVLQARVNVESHEISRFFYIFCYEMAPNQL